MQQGNGVLMSTVTSQRVRGQLSVRNREMTSTPVFAREESRHSVIQTTVQLMVILGFHDRLRNPRISKDVFPQALVVVGIVRNFCSRLPILNDRCTFQGSCLRNCQQTCRNLTLCPVLREIPQNS